MRASVRTSTIGAMGKLDLAVRTQISEIEPTSSSRWTPGKSTPLTTPQVAGSIGLILLAGIVAAFATPSADFALIVPIITLISSLLFVTEFLDPGDALGRALSIGLYAAAIVLAATTGPALAGLVMLAGTAPLLFLTVRRWSVAHRLLTDVSVSMVTASGFWAVEQSRDGPGDWPLWTTIPLQSSLALAVVLLIRRIPGATYRERHLSHRHILLIVIPLTVVAVSFEASLPERHLTFTTMVFLVVLVCLIILARIMSRSRSHTKRAIEGLATALNYRHPDTSAHSSRVFALVSRMLESVPGLESNEREAILTASLIHDIGKIATPDRALLKPGALTLDERAIMQRHSAIGEAIIRRMDGLEATAPIVRHHHERWDGAGYPDGLVGPIIPLGARMIAVADTYDAMTHDRVYRRALGHDEALAELLAERGRQFDPSVVDIFSRLLASDQFVANRRPTNGQVAS